VSAVTDLWIATRKGVFVATRATKGANWSVSRPLLPGYEVYHVLLDPEDESGALVAANHPIWGHHVFRTGDAGETWSMTSSPLFSRDSGREVRALWHLARTVHEGDRRWYLGVDPGALFSTGEPDKGWEWVESLDAHPTRAAWQLAKGGMTLHSIQIDPRAPDRLYVAVSAGGCYRTDDGGVSWHPINDGIRADYLADPLSPAGHNPHALRLHPARPDRLYRQDHCGVYRSDDRGRHWMEITGDLPSEFGYALAVDPADPDRAWVIPEEGSHMRCVCEGKLRVYETRDAGATWMARTEGLPQHHAYVSVLRDGLCAGGSGVFVGTSTGQVYASADATLWERVPGCFPGVLALAVRP